MLIWKNARKYNSFDSPAFLAATDLYYLSKSLLKSVENPEAEGDPWKEELSD